MSHNICDKKIFYTGEKPWHGIGTELQNPATAEEAIVAAGLDYEVRLKNVHFVNQDGNRVEVPDYFASVRYDKGEEIPLSVVGARYRVVQNKESFDFFDAVVGERQAIYHTAGALGQGERIWLLAKLPKDLILFNDDRVEKYLCLTNSHDGKSALRVYFTPVRVVCQNTLNASLQDAHQGISIRHTVNANHKISEARRILGLSLKFYEGFDETVKAFAGKQLQHHQVESYFDRVLGFGSRVPDRDEASTRKLNIRKELFRLHEEGRGSDLPGVRGTVWGAYNAVTEYADWFQTFRNAKEDPSNRLRSIWFGASAALKERAYEEAVALLV